MTEQAAAPERPEHANRKDFIAFLLKLADPEHGARGALAALRRSLQDERGMAASAFPYVMPFVSKSDDPLEERAFFLVGALFALHPEHAEGVSLGDLFRRINNETTEGKQGKDNPSTRARFVALLDAHGEDVDVHVRHAISLGRAKGIPLDWRLLLRDLRAWRHPDRWVQRQLARDFWRPAPDAPPPSSTAETAPEREAAR